MFYAGTKSCRRKGGDERLMPCDQYHTNDIISPTLPFNNSTDGQLV